MTIENLPDQNSRFGMGISAYGGSTVTATGCLLEGNTEMGVIVEGATVFLTDVTISNTRPSGNGRYGQAVLAQAGATVDIVECTFEDNVTHRLYLYGAGTSATVTDTRILRTQFDEAGGYGNGIAMEAGAELVLLGGLLEQNHSSGLFVHGMGSTAQLLDVDFDRPDTSE